MDPSSRTFEERSRKFADGGVNVVGWVCDLKEVIENGADITVINKTIEEEAKSEERPAGGLLQCLVANVVPLMEVALWSKMKPKVRSVQADVEVHPIWCLQAESRSDCRELFTVGAYAIVKQGDKFAFGGVQVEIGEKCEFGE